MNNIRNCRERAGMSQTDLAIAAGIHPSTLNRVERGVNPNMQTAKRIAVALDCQIAKLFPKAEQLRRY